jgi:uncharacterized protein (DUF362 family)
MKEKYECETSHCGFGNGNPVSRRDFLRTTAMGAAAAALAGSQLGCSASGSNLPREGLGNLFMEADKPILVVVEGNNLSTMLEAGLDAIGGLDRLVAGKKVVLKPNVLNSEPPPVTTPIETVLAVGKHAQIGGAASITICDSNSSASARAVKFEGLGYPERLEGTGFKMDAVGFDETISHVFVEKSTWRSHPRIGVVKTLHEADVVINIPVVKRHGGARFTCALKNHFGSVYGSLRFVAHRKMDKEGDAGKEFFDIALAEFADAVRPELNIVDARTLLTRAGPSIKPNSEVKEGVNRIILCGDMVATDVYCARLMAENDEAFSPDMISTQFEAAVQLGLGAGDLKDVVVKEIIV